MEMTLNKMLTFNKNKGGYFWRLSYVEHMFCGPGINGHFAQEGNKVSEVTDCITQVSLMCIIDARGKKS